MNYWQKFSEASLPEKKGFYSNLNTKSITKVDYKHSKSICKDFYIKNLGQYYQLYVQSYALLFSDVLTNF